MQLENGLKKLKGLKMPIQNLDKCPTCGAETKEDCQCPEECESCGA